MNHFFNCTGLLLMALLLFAAGGVSAADYQSGGPVEVSADRLELDDNEQVLVFTGNAVASQNDVKIHGDRLIVQYRGEDREIEQVVAEGNVRIVQENRTATGGRAVFFRDEGRVVLTENPRVSQGKNFVQGHEITLLLNDKRSIVSGGSDGRVNAVFSPKTEAQP